jgi:Toastrack DUF4097
MVAVTDTSPDAIPAPAAVDDEVAAPPRNIGVVPTASMITGAAIAVVWFWIPLTILILGISSIPSGIGFALSVVVFVYLMRGVEHVGGRAGELTLALPPDLARRLTVTTQQDVGVVLAHADLDQLIARTDNGEVVLSGSARRIEIHTENGDVVTRNPISVSEGFSANTANGDIEVDFAETAPRTVDVTSENGDVIVALPARGPYVVNAHTENGDTAVRVPQATDRENAAAVVTARSENGDVIIDDLR